MKTIFNSFRVLALAALTVFMFSCTAENGPKPNKDKDQPNLGAGYEGFSPSGEHPNVDDPCSSRLVYNLVDRNGNANNGNYTHPYGTVDCLNDDDFVYLFLTLGRDWFTDKVNLFVGADVQEIPMDLNGNMDVSLFPYTFNINPAMATWVLRIDPARIAPGCNSYAFSTEVVRLAGFFGGLDESTRTTTWALSETVADGQVFQHCWANCGPSMTLSHRPNEDGCTTVFPGFAPLDCQELSVAIDNGVAPYQYLWSTGEVGQTVRVCPTQTSTYWVQVTDANNNKDQMSFTVNVVDASAGHNGNKALVCHVPPGNPANVQMIEISKSALSAHIEAFRTENHNPNHGHDSGCRLGPCTSNPCGLGL